MNLYIYISLIIFPSLITYFICKYQKEQFLCKVKIFNKKFFNYLIEWFISLMLVLFVLRLFCELEYYSSFNIILYVLSFVLMIILLLFGYIIYNKYNNVETAFAVLMIPLGVVFCFLMLPDYVPDEQSHFQRAWQVSNFKLSCGLYDYIDADYAVMKFGNYKDIFSNLYMNFSPKYTLNDQACGYNFLCYIVSATALNVGKILHTSLYISYYMGRLANAAFYTFMVSKAIKITPKCKKIFFVLALNPMFIQLASSYSADMMISSTLIMSAAYFIYLYCNEKPICEKDILVVIALITVIAVSKYVYLPFFGIYFAIIPKLLKMSKKYWIFTCVLTLFAILFILWSLKLGSTSESVAAQVQYCKEANVDGKRQIEFLKAGKLNVVRVLIATFNEKILYYFDYFVNRLGWEQIFINIISFVLYYITLFSSACVETFNLKLRNRIWFAIVGCVISILVVMGMYLYFTPVGWQVAQGVQGRYMIPCAILFLLVISNNLLEKLNNTTIFMFSLFIVNVLVTKDILLYFL